MNLACAWPSKIGPFLLNISSTSHGFARRQDYCDRSVDWRDRSPASDPRSHASGRSGDRRCATYASWIYPYVRRSSEPDLPPNAVEIVSLSVPSPNGAFTTTAYIPSGSGPFPVVIFSPGFFQKGIAYAPYAKRVGSWGIIEAMLLQMRGPRQS